MYLAMVSHMDGRGKNNIFCMGTVKLNERCRNAEKQGYLTSNKLFKNADESKDWSFLEDTEKLSKTYVRFQPFLNMKKQEDF